MEQAAPKTPVHVWIVGLLATAWNGFGCYDYTMTRTKGAAYVEAMMPGADGNAFMAYIDSFPIHASVGWALGVWLGLAGSVLILARSRFAVPALLVSLLGALIGIIYQILNPLDDPAMSGGANAVIPYIIILIAAALLLYARAMRAKGVLR